MVFILSTGVLNCGFLPQGAGVRMFPVWYPGCIVDVTALVRGGVVQRSWCEVVVTCGML